MDPITVSQVKAFRGHPVPQERRQQLRLRGERRGDGADAGGRRRPQDRRLVAVISGAGGRSPQQ